MTVSICNVIVVVIAVVIVAVAVCCGEFARCYEGLLALRLLRSLGESRAFSKGREGLEEELVGPKSSEFCRQP